MTPPSEAPDPVMLWSALRASPYASFILNDAGDILFHNRRAARVFGENDEMVPQFYQLCDASEIEVQKSIREGVVKGSLALPLRKGRHLTTPSGTMFRISLLRSSQPGERLFLLTQDQLKVTAEALGTMNARRMEARNSLETLERAHLELRDAFVAMETFTRAASHDLRTPLNTLTGLMDLLDRNFAPELPKEAQEYLEHMARALGQMEGLITDLLDHARSLSSQIVAEPIQVRKFLEDLLSEMAYAIKEAGASVSLEGPGFMVMAEPVLIRVLFSNLLSNALKHPRAEVSLRITVQLTELPGGTHAVAVADNGTGFDPEMVKEAFKPFRKLNKNRDGAGLGLATSHEICQRHNWSIDAKTFPGTGSRFTVSMT